MRAVPILLLALVCAMPAAAVKDAAHPRSLPGAEDRPSSELVREVERRRGGPLLPQAHAAEESRRTIAALRVYASSGAREHFDEALRRARHLASFDLQHSSREDSRSIAWALALAYDWLSPHLAAAHKRALLVPLRERTAALINNPSPEGVPTLTAIVMLLGDDVPESKQWLRKLAREVS